MRALLDVNVLIALHDESHTQHVAARRWVAEEIAAGWASCALTENGFVRVVSQPRYPADVSPSMAIEMLRAATSTPHHERWPCDVALWDGSAIDATRVHGPKQVTDLYLLALAVRHGGRLVTFDGRIPRSAVPGATDEHLVVL
ncbi:TA system VapC family ribonuclease toxin [Patulibacter brassicae]|jgi:toxin-antitoxin system PIN domain toxin|uniref:Ribonuclease VapC n=1 Tax=Patulibacter brassicae TaxID=1705717 RepID=A0ABU4VLG6_9ACTN|nr:TA system VapC family ribonuclease toxin [Patulibacter brassicae]MDX8152310.1 TA system VapC family ribonuclease toxin [Patulibacter brassicae]